MSADEIRSQDAVADEVWAYDGPHESGGNVHVTMTRSQAIAYQRSIRPYAPDAPDANVFADWQLVHWAYRASEKVSGE